MKFIELDTVVLDRDLPEHGLRKGDIGAIVHVHDEDVPAMRSPSAPRRGDG